METQPKSVLQEVIESRNGVDASLYESYVLDELAVERLKRKIAGELKRGGNSNLHRGALHHELAYLLGLQGRVGVSGELAKAQNYGIQAFAIGLSTSHIAIMNGHVSEARETVERLSKVDDLPEAARKLLFAHFGQVGMLEAMVANAKGGREVRYEHVAAGILMRMGIEDIELTKRLDTACRVIRANIKHPILGRKLFASDGEGMLFRYVVKAPVDDLLRINDQVLDALMDEHDGPLDEVLSIMVTPWSYDKSFVREEAYNVQLD
jgi:hypothetical protein